MTGAVILFAAGNKGGSGKTSTAHAIAHGLALHGIRAFLITTDERDLLPDSERRYAILDGRTQDRLTDLLDRVAALEGVVVVIDGAARRPRIDDAISRIATLTLIPFKQSEEDLVEARRDLDRLPDAVGLPNDWPTQAWARRSADRELETTLMAYKARLMSPQPSINGYVRLLHRQGPAQPLNGPCRQLALRVLDRAGLSLFDFREYAPKRRNAGAP